MTNDQDDSLAPVTLDELHAVEGGDDFWCPIPFDPFDPYPWKHPWSVDVIACPPLV